MKVEQLIIRKMYYANFGYGKELVQYAGESPKIPGAYGFYTEDGGVIIVKKSQIESMDIMEVL